MYHSEVIRFNGHYQTLECDRMDVSGLCLGHKISRKEFLERYCDGIKVEAKTTKACYLGWDDVVKSLLDKKADVNMKDMHGNTALIIASETEDSSIVKNIIKEQIWYQL